MRVCVCVSAFPSIFFRFVWFIDCSLVFYRASRVKSSRLWLEINNLPYHSMIVKWENMFRCSKSTSAINFNLYVNTNDIRWSRSRQSDSELRYLFNTVFNGFGLRTSELIAKRFFEDDWRKQRRWREKEKHSNNIIWFPSNESPRRISHLRQNV